MAQKRNNAWRPPFLVACLLLSLACPATATQKKNLPASAPAVTSDDQRQVRTSDDSNPPPTPTELAAPSGVKLVLSEYEFWLSAEVLIFGFAVLLAEFLLLRKAKITAEEALRVYAVSLIIIGTLFAITAGFDSNQIAPAMGLFGTIAGYLLGRRAPAQTMNINEEQK